MEIFKSFSKLATTLALLISVAYAQGLQITPSQEDGSYVLSFMGEPSEKIVVKLLNESGSILHRAVFNDTQQVIRKYRFEDTEAGTYVFEVRNGENVITQSVNYTPESMDPISSVNLLTDADHTKCQLVVDSDPQRNIMVSIYSADQKLLYEEETNVSDQSHRVYNFERVLEDEVVIVVSDDVSTITKRLALR